MVSLAFNSQEEINMSQEGRAILESTLGKLLGFDDGASDVLDHLLSVESKEDLLEYLSQLLGDATAEVLAFVDNVGRFKRGDTLALIEEATNVQEEDSKPSANATTNFSNKKKPPPSSKNNALQARRNNKKQNKSRVPPPKQQNRKSPPPPASKSVQQSSTDQSLPVKQAKVEQKPVEKSRPSRGIPKIVCGCFGTKHGALTNCLYCGRISCRKEGYDFCAFCGFMVEEIKDDGSHGSDRAWMQKERLLRFDREFARRTEIFDDQADYQAPSTWMTEEERQEAEENLSRQMEALKRPKQTLNLAI